MNPPVANVSEWLASSVFVPNSATATKPIDALSDQFERFVYVDWEIDAVGEMSFPGYSITTVEPIVLEEAQKRRLGAISVDGVLGGMRAPSIAPHASMITLEKRGAPKAQYQVLFVGGDSLSAFRELYWGVAAPAVVAIIQPGFAARNSWCKTDSDFARLVLGNARGAPRFVLHDGNDWWGYLQKWARNGLFLLERPTSP